MKYQRSAVFHW